MSTDLTARVREALKNAEANDYEFTGLSSGDIAADIMDHDSEIEYENFDDVVDAVDIVRNGEK